PSAPPPPPHTSPLPLPAALPICSSPSRSISPPIGQQYFAFVTTSSAWAPSNVNPSSLSRSHEFRCPERQARQEPHHAISSAQTGDRKSTRLNSSHVSTSYAVFCL